MRPAQIFRIPGNLSELKDGEGADSLHSRCVLSHPKGVQNGSWPVLGHGFRDLLDLCCRDASDAFAHIEQGRAKGKVVVRL